MSYDEIKNKLFDLSYIAVIDDDEQERIEQEKKKKLHDDLVRSRLSVIPPRYKNATFDNFITDKPSLIDYMKTGGSAILYGNNGTGKTHLAYASIRYQIEKGNDAKYVLAADYFSLIKQSFSNPSIDFKEYYDCPYLVIDEVDKRFGTQTEFIGLYQLINHRYNSLLPTVLITNSGKDELIEVIGVSSFDRIVEDGKLINIDGKNYRRK